MLDNYSQSQEKSEKNSGPIPTQRRDPPPLTRLCLALPFTRLSAGGEIAALEAAGLLDCCEFPHVGRVGSASRSFFQPLG